MRKRYVIFTNFIHDMCRWTLINVLNFQYHGNIILVGTQRNVTMAAYGKSIGGSIPVEGVAHLSSRVAARIWLAGVLLVTYTHRV